MVFSSHKKVKIDKDLYDRLEAAAKSSGYSSTDELIQHVLEREIGNLKKPDSKDDSDPTEFEKQEVERQLRGLGYLE